MVFAEVLGALGRAEGVTEARTGMVMINNGIGYLIGG